MPNQYQDILNKMNLICPPGANRRSTKTHEEILRHYIDVTLEAISKAQRESNKSLRAQGILELDCAGIRDQIQYKFICERTGKRTRWLSWLNTHYALYEVCKRAKHVRQQRTRVRLNMENIVMNLSTEYLKPKNAQEKFTAQIQPILERYQAGDDTALAEITTVKINLRSLEAARAYYLKEIQKASDQEDQFRLYSYIQACDQIRATCEASAAWAYGDPDSRDASGYYGEMFVRVKQSEFGRTYHLGISPQTLPRDLRRACVAPCYQYDVQASVFAFYVYLNALLKNQNLHISMPYTEALCADRQAFRSCLVSDCLNTLRISPEYKTQIIKRAITALGFGARFTGADSWLIPDSDPENPEYGESALKTIILDPRSRQLFREHELIQGLGSEIAALAQVVKTHWPEIMGSDPDPRLLNKRGQIQASLALAYLYQHFETNFMEDFISTCEIPQDQIRLRVHDAIYLSKPIQNPDLLERFQQKYQGIFRFERQKLEPYSGLDPEIAHKEFVQAEESQARNYYSDRYTQDQRKSSPDPVLIQQYRALELANISLREVQALDPDWAEKLSQARTHWKDNFLDRVMYEVRLAQENSETESEID